MFPKRARRSTASLFLTALALLLGLALSTWCVSLAVSVSELRNDVTANVKLMSVLEEFRDALLALNAEAPNEQTAARWREEYSHLLSAVPLDAGDGPIAASLNDLEVALRDLNKAAQAPLALEAAAPGDDEPATRFEEARTSVYARLRAVVTAIRHDQATISATLADKWRQLYFLAFFSIATVVVLAVLYRRARADSFRHQEAEAKLRESEQRFQSMLAAAPDIILILDAVGGYRKIFPRESDLLVAPAEQILGRTVHDVLPAESARAVQEVIDRTLRTGALQEFEYPLTTAGQDRWFAARVVPVGTDDDPCVLWVSRDMTARKRAEEDLRESERRFRQTDQALKEREELFRSVIGTANDGVIVADRHGTITIWNKASEEMFGYTAEEAKGSSLSLIVPERLRSAHEHGLSAAGDSTPRTTGRLLGQTVELLGRCKDGSELPIELSLTSWETAAGLFYTGIVRDITERKRAEEALRESEARFRSIFERVGAGMATVTANGKLLQVNPAFCRFLGYSAAELLDMGVLGFTHPDERPATLQRLEEVRAGKRRSIDTIKRYVRKDGVTVWGHVTSVWLFDDRQRPLYGISMVQDITRHREADEALREAKEDLERRVELRTTDLTAANRKLKQEISERKRAVNVQAALNRVLAELAAGGSLDETLHTLVRTTESLHPGLQGSVLLLDDDKRHLRHGAAPSLPAFYTSAIDGLEIGPRRGSCGAAAFLGKRVIVEDVMTHANWEPFRDLAARADIRACWSEPIRSSAGEILGTFAIYYHEPRGPDRAVLEYIAAAANLAGIAIERDRAEAELRESQARLRVTDRLTSLGTLAAGLGHDINQVLFPIRCRIDALDSKSLPEDSAELMGSTRETVNYLQQIANGLRILAKDPEDSEEPMAATSLSSWWAQAGPLVTKMVPDGIEIEPQLADDLPNVAVAPYNLTQAVSNLVLNAAESMPSGGRVRVWARANGSTVRIGVTDQGIGMTDEVRDRAFDPGFTTKKRRLSTGWGLSLVHSLITLSGGSIEVVESAPGAGTTVVLLVPVAANGSGPASPGDGVASSAAVTLRDRRKAAWITNMLTVAGYDVRLAEDGDPRDSSLWVTEPTDDNLETARVFVARRPEARVIVLGGGTTSAAGRGHPGPNGDWSLLGASIVEDADNLDAIKYALSEAAVRS